MKLFSIFMNERWIKKSCRDAWWGTRWGMRWDITVSSHHFPSSSLQCKTSFTIFIFTFSLSILSKLSTLYMSEWSISFYNFSKIFVHLSSILSMNWDTNSSFSSLFISVNRLRSLSKICIKFICSFEVFASSASLNIVQNAWRFQEHWFNLVRYEFFFDKALKIRFKAFYCCLFECSSCLEHSATSQRDLFKSSQPSRSLYYEEDFFSKETSRSLHNVSY